MRRWIWIGFALLASFAHAQSTVPHPRLILDAPTLSALRSRAAANTPQWQHLKNYCDAFVGGTVNYPDQNAYPNAPNIGQGYQGDGYWAPLWSEALCYQTLKVSDPVNAAKYGAVAASMAVKMSILFPAAHGEDPCTDDGYVMRFFGVGMGILYDWVYELLTPSQRSQIYTTANSWLTNWENVNGCAGFAYVHPVGNYFAGYFHAKTVLALATAGDNPQAPALWSNWQTTQFNTAASNPPHIGVQPYYAANMKGGGWPEGFGNYGPLATLNMSLPAWEVKTATGIDLTTAAAPYTFPIDVADYLMHFTWPTRNYIDDRDTNHSNGNPDAPPPSSTDIGLFVQALGVQRYWNAPHANVFQQYVNDVIAASSGGVDEWEAFLFYDPNGTTAALTTLPLSYFAPGPNAVAARSDWTTSATWMSFRAGPYIEGPGAEEEGFDQGAPAFVRGGTPLLVNATGWIVHEPGGNDDENRLIDDEIYGNRILHNIFYVRKSDGSGGYDDYGQTVSTPGESQTHVAAYEDGFNYAYVLATHLEDMYRPDSGGHAQVASWSREIVYLRPNRFIIYDRTAAGNATGGSTASDQFLAFHFPANPAVGSAPAGEHRYDVTYNTVYAGAMTTVLPMNAALSANPMYPASTTPKVWQVQIHAPNSTAAQTWLNVFDLGTSIASVATASNITVTTGAATGTLLAATGGNQAVLFNTGAAGTTIAGSIAYTVPAATTAHYITEVPANTGYNVSASVDAGIETITVAPGGPWTSSNHGVLTFAVDATGHVSPNDRIFGNGFEN